MPTKTAAVSLSITLMRISDLLCCALEGGSNYWYMVEKFIEPKKLTFRTDVAQVYRHLDYPLSEGGALLISDAKGCDDSEKRTERLDIDACRRGLQVMAEKFPQHFANFSSENEDAETGDVFLQCALFGDVVYG